MRALAENPASSGVGIAFEHFILFLRILAGDHRSFGRRRCFCMEMLVTGVVAVDH